MLPALATACLLMAAVIFTNIYTGQAAVRRKERSAYATALNATDTQLEAMPVEHLLDLRVRLAGFAEREWDLLDSSLAAAERLDAVIVAKDTARRITRIA